MIFKKRINSAFKNIRIPAYLVTNASDIFYLTGVGIDGFYILFLKKKIYAVCSPLLSGQLKTLLPRIKIVSGNNMIGAIIDLLKKSKVRVLGFNPEKVSYSLFSKIKPHFKVVEADPIKELRRIKDNFEIEVIKKSCKIAAKVFNLVKKLVKPGVSEKEIAFKIEEYFAKYFAKPAFPPIVAFGSNTANPHHVPLTRKVRKNDIVTIDLGASFKGYCSDLTRTFFLGKIPARKKNLYNIVEKAQKAAIKRIKAAKNIKELDKTARDLIEKEGFGSYFIHSTGHSLGIEVHEEPRVSSSVTGSLSPGMIITIEPGIYLPNKFGVRIEDTVLVTNKGSIILTR